jgi:hypothetical protein
MKFVLDGTLGYEKPQSAQAPLYGFLSATFGAGDIASQVLLPAPNVSYNQTLYEMPA